MDVPTAHLACEVPVERQQWIQTWQALRECKQWKPWVKRAVLKHTTQEKIAFEINQYHKQIVMELERFGMQLAPCEDDTVRPAYGCRRCDACFPTSQQLAVHEFRLHGVRTQERHCVQLQ